MSTLAYPKDQRLTIPQVPTIPKVHEIMKTKRAVLSKTAFKEWLSDRAQIVKQAQAHLPAIKEWERRFQRDYRTDEALEVERLSALYRTRILKSVSLNMRNSFSDKALSQAGGEGHV